MQRPLVFLSLIALFTACWEVGGANTQESVRGNADHGNLIGYQLIVGEDGRHLIATGAEGQGVYSVDLQRFSSVLETYMYSAPILRQYVSRQIEWQ